MAVERRGYSPAESGLITEPHYPPDIPQEHLHITFAIGAQSSQRLQAVMTDVYDFAREVSLEYGQQLLAWMDKKRQSLRGIHPAIQEQVENGGYTPVFTFYDRHTVQDFYQRVCPLQKENKDKLLLTVLREDELVMTFDMPEAVSRLWWHAKTPYAKKDAPGTEKGIKPRKIRQLERSGGYVPFPFFGDAY